MRSRYIQNRIFAILSDCKRHTVKEIAEKLEVNESTVYRIVCKTDDIRVGLLGR